MPKLLTKIRSYFDSVSGIKPAEVDRIANIRRFSLNEDLGTWKNRGFDSIIKGSGQDAVIKKLRIDVSDLTVSLDAHYSGIKTIQKKLDNAQVSQDQMTAHKEKRIGEAKQALQTKRSSTVKSYEYALEQTNFEITQLENEIQTLKIIVYGN